MSFAKAPFELLESNQSDFLAPEDLDGFLSDVSLHCLRKKKKECACVCAFNEKLAKVYAYFVGGGLANIVVAVVLEAL